jgi:CMP-N,N'-diacetyllegionaminic acid synthase
MKYMEGNLNKNFKILIPARGGSKRIPNKNIIDINGRPLISYVIASALKLTGDVFVSTNNREIADISAKCGAKIIWRPTEISGDNSKTEDAVKHFIYQVDSTDIIVVMQATTPLVSYNKVFDGINLMDKYDSVISVSEDRSFYWDSYGKPVNFIPGERPRTQDMLPWYKENGAFYITSKKAFLETSLFYSGKVGFVEMSNEESIDIDNIEDVKLLEKIIKKF